MTTQEKVKIIAMRAQGCGYKSIAGELGLSVNTVKSYCQRNREVDPKQTGCKNCGALLIQTPHHKQKQFCCDRCRTKWWNAHRNELNRTAVHEQTCPQCGNTYVGYNSRKQVYCSRACYANARRKETAYGT